jgi:membrane-associated protease RseP (regulator of RpoE activity)
MHSNHSSSQSLVQGRLLALAAAIGAVVGVAAALLALKLWQSGPTVVLDPSRVAATEPLAQALETEREARRQLTNEVQMLRADIDTIVGILADLDSVAQGDARESLATEAEGAAAEPEAAPAEAQAAGVDGGGVGAEVASRGRPWFDAAALVAAGLPPSEVQRLRDRWEEYQMDKLYLWDRAMREGEQGWRLARESRAELEGEIRQELGDEDYDLLLYASGQHNRVTVQEILSQSPGLRAGLIPGDVIISYDGIPVYRPRDLRSAIAASRAGSLVWLEVQSESGEQRNLRIQSGPVGIKMGVKIQAPSLR